MADNLEIRIEQLTDAIRGLYNKPSLTPAEINNAFNTMLQRFENQTNLGTDKLVQIISNEIKKTVEERHGALQNILYNLEDVIKNASTQLQNPKFEMQMSKLSSDLDSVYTKLNNQELQMQKFAQSIEAMKSSGTAAEMVKLSNDFATFSRGFDSITSTLNSNFSEFLTQVQGYSQKEELNQIKYQLGEIIKNSQIIVTAGDRLENFANKMYSLSSKEDTNFINEKITILTSFLSDLKAYMEKNDFESREQIRTMVSNIETRLSTLNLTSMNEIVNKSYADMSGKLAAETSNINSNLAQLTGEIQKVNTTVLEGISGRTEEIKMQLKSVADDYQNLKNALCTNVNMEEAVNAILKSNSETIDLSHDFIQSQMQRVEDAIKKQEETEKQHLVNAIELLKNEFSQVSDRICSLEADIGSQSLDEALKKITQCVETMQSADAFQQLSNIMRNVTNEVNSSIETLRENFEKAQDGSSVAALQQINESLPKISDRLEVFRNHVVSENSANIMELKQQFAEVVETITTRVEQITESIKTDVKALSDGNSNDVKVDLQNMSNHIMDTVENINVNITREFNDHKTNIDELLSRINDYEDKFRDKLNSIESTFETLSQESTDRINDSLSLTQLQVQETLASMKEDLLAGILGINKNNKTNFELIDTKIESLIKKAATPESAVTSLQNTNQQELLAEIESKVERCNLQQIHNGKELLGEIQNLNSELSFKIENLNLQGNSEIPPSVIRGIDDKVQSLLENSMDKEEEVKLIKAHMDLRMKEVIQKIAKIVSVFKPDEEGEEDAQKASASVRLDELLSQLEYLKNNIFDEIKDGFNQLDKKEEIIADISKNVGETLSNTVYIKNNTLNEIKGVVEEKLEAIKNFEFLIEDIKNILQNNQQSTMDRINSMNEDVNSLRAMEERVSNKVEEQGYAISERTIGSVSSRIDEVFGRIDGVHGRLDGVSNAIDSKMDDMKSAIAEEVKNTIFSKIDTNSINTSERIISVVNDSADETSQKVETMVNEASERIASTVIDNIKGSLLNIETFLGNIQKRKDGATAIASGLNDELAQKISEGISEKLNDVLNQIEKTASDGYSMTDLESDFAKLRLSIEKSNKNIGTDFQNIGGWLKNTTARLDGLTRMVDTVAKKVEQTEKLGLEEIKNRMVQSEKEIANPQKAEELAAVVQKKYKIQEMRLEELDEKISMLLQKQSEGFDAKQFIDLFYDNTTNTKSLVSRIDALENKLNTMSKNIEKIISYIDE